MKPYKGSLTRDQNWRVMTEIVICDFKFPSLDGNKNLKYFVSYLVSLGISPQPEDRDYFLNRFPKQDRRYRKDTENILSFLFQKVGRIDLSPTSGYPWVRLSLENST